MDHKKLTRTTKQGNNFILVFVDHFSKWVRYVPVPDESAYTTARIFVAEIIALFGKVDFLLSDKGPGFMSAFFAVISKILGVKHKTSASLAKRTNGLAEKQIRALNQALKLYCGPDENDKHIEKYLPLIELGLRASANSDSNLSPFLFSMVTTCLYQSKQTCKYPTVSTREKRSNMRVG